MESSTEKNKKGGCLFWILIIAAIAAFFTNPDQTDFDQYIESQISRTGDQELYYNHIYTYVLDQYRQSTTVKNYYLFSIYEKEKHLYKNYHYITYNKPSHIVNSKYVALFGNFWKLEKKYQPL